MAKMPAMNAVTIVFGGRDAKEELSTQEDITEAVGKAFKDLGIDLVMSRVEIQALKVKVNGERA